ncbi:DUF2188 domain-containing protein [Cupriavidus sp. WKF15]|uniref:DUF2188 domain-containing protein n=1 Tax=Cupriavidus sp. WKF15 TaxID=3032282 RepID=UPI0023E1AC07|nr:DUF2188 domain-containing protein [Cupriavidus sp. WKF15]WER46630.1 DUF2188 domain-containing protein [Cupriavidus sp. WKF15]
MKSMDVHVVPALQGWAVEEASNPASRKLFATQEDAIEVATEMARQSKSELFIHGRDGQIRSRSSFGHDPRQIRG